MNITYIAFARMPTEKAHGLTIAKSCESFVRAGAEVTLVIPRRKTTVQGDLFEAYGLERNFKVVEIGVPDLVGRFGSSAVAFWLHYYLFFVAVKARILFGSREQILYTREAPLCLFRWYGFKVVLESHMIPKRRGLYFFLARRAHRVVVISKALKGAFVKAGFDEGKLLVAPSGVDLSVFDIDISKDDARRQLELPQGAHIAVYTGNFTTMGQDKGLSDIIEALKSAPGILFVGVGGSEKDIARYETQAKQAGVADRVILRGYAPQKTLAVYQKAADVLLMPFPDTPHYRSHMSPVKMFEYMASGRPIIASDLPTIREVLNDRNAVVIPPGDSRRLSEAMLTLAAAGPESEALAESAKSTVAAFAWSERAKRIFKFVA